MSDGDKLASDVITSATTNGTNGTYLKIEFNDQYEARPNK